MSILQGVKSSISYTGSPDIPMDILCTHLMKYNNTHLIVLFKSKINALNCWLLPWYTEDNHPNEHRQWVSKCPSLIPIIRVAKMDIKSTHFMGSNGNSINHSFCPTRTFYMIIWIFPIEIFQLSAQIRPSKWKLYRCRNCQLFALIKIIICMGLGNVYFTWLLIWQIPANKI